MGATMLRSVTGDIAKMGRGTVAGFVLVALSLIAPAAHSDLAPTGRSDDRIIIKFEDAAEVRLRSRGWVSLTGQDLGKVLRMLDPDAMISVVPLFGRSEIDGSGIAGDAPCSSGQTQGCDDNSPGVANGPSQGTCHPIPGTPNNSLAPGAPCMTGEQCEAGHRCSRAQEDSNGDGLGDVFPGADGRELRVTDEGGLFEYFDFADEIEPGSSFAFDLWSAKTYGDSIAIACGSCDAADFSNPVFGIYPGQDLCGYQWWDDTITSIVLNDDALCLEIVESGRRYDLDILSFKSQFTGCIDADGGDSCEDANYNTSYTRSLFVPEPGAWPAALAALLTIAALRRQRSGRPRVFSDAP